MKVSNLLKEDKITISLEVFPPKTTTNNESIIKAALDVASLNPSYMSVTYGAGGSNRANTIDVAKRIQNEKDVATIAHLTCVLATKDSIKTAVDEMKAAGIDNILALRGDRPSDFDGDPFVDYKYASDLIYDLKEMGDFSIGGACYPEGHPDAATKTEDILNLKKKIDAGCEYLNTQMFFDNNIYYNFLYRVREAGITVPVVPGIMPITRAIQVKNAVKLSGSNIPERFKAIVDRFGSDPASMQQAGIAYATDQIIDLIANGVNHIHVYSMNKPDIAEAILNNISEIIK